MAKSWSIEITLLADGTAAFRPDLPDAVQGQPLGVNAGDDVTWNNKTGKTLTLQSIPAGTYITDPIPPGQVSSPIFNVAKSLIYACTDPTRQQHAIVVF